MDLVIERLSEDVRPPTDDTFVRLKMTGNVMEIMYADGVSSPPAIRRISADLYEDLNTGEVKEFQHIENRSENLQSVARSLARLRDYLNTNIDDVSRCRWVTLTYAENMTDTQRLYEDFKAFNRRHRKRVGHYEYIVAAEPQGRGAWHLHVVMIFPRRAPFIPNEDMAADWRKGFVKVKKLDDVDNVGAYLTAYLGDMELNQETVKIIGLGEAVRQSRRGNMKVIDYLDEDGNPQQKAIIKGARLCFYPPKFNLYRCSRGIKKPDIVNMTEKEAQKKVSGATLTFEKTLQIKGDERAFSRILNYRYYNQIR